MTSFLYVWYHIIHLHPCSFLLTYKIWKLYNKKKFDLVVKGQGHSDLIHIICDTPSCPYTYIQNMKALDLNCSDRHHYMIKNKLTLWSKVRVTSFLYATLHPVLIKYIYLQNMKSLETKKLRHRDSCMIKKKSNLFTLWSTVKVTVTTFSCPKTYNTGANPGFQAREGALKKICWGISCEKSRFYAKKSYFFQF